MLKILNKINVLRGSPQAQHGAVLMVMLVILVVAAATMLLKSLNSATPQLARAKITADALAQAKEALIGYATSVDLSGSKRPGDLPCPDNHPFGDINEGSPTTPCNSNALGRLPWKKLGLPDLRDSSGERLWYAVSTNFKDTLRTGILNSDTPGTISVFSPDGALIHDGGGSTGAVAVIIAPGAVLTRQGASSPQDRSSTGYLTAANYLDTPSAVADPKDNASFIDASSTDGFIQGKIQIYDPATKSSNVILNDQLLAITQDNMMQAIQKRVAGEVKNCLDSYATAGNGRYPWATPITDTTNYFDISTTVFGRIPNRMDSSKTDSAPAIPAMSNQWPGSCQTHTIFIPNSWWLQWRELVFYGISDKFKPSNSVAPVFSTTCAIAGNCLTVNNSSTPAKYVVIVSGKKLTNPDQSLRDSNKTVSFYYLEEGNESADQAGAYTFIQSSPSATFNDTAVYQ